MILTRGERTIEMMRGDALDLLSAMTGAPFGAVITDPPYASGGQTLGARQQPSALKYTSTQRRCPMPDFLGDQMDQRSWTGWMTDVLREARRLSAPGAPLCVFVDWRQLPSATDALQRAGWTWRGIAVWDKVNSRPQRGRFRQQAEFVVWGSNGAMPIDRPVGVLPGVIACVPPSSAGQRYHQTEKPFELMRQIVRIAEPGAVILDPFAGSGTTLLASAIEGYDSVGCELSDEIYETACARLQK